MKKIIKENLKNRLKESIKIFSTIGTYQFYILISIVFLTLKYYKEFFFLILGLFFIYLFTIPIRLLFFKDRPTKKKYSNLLEKIDASSTPSGHVTRSIFLAIFLIGFFDLKILFSIFIVLIFVLISYSRIYLKQHFPIDILIGALLGIVVFSLTNLII